MSALVATGLEGVVLPWCVGGSDDPIAGHGMMNRTDFSVRRKIPVLASIASFGMTM